MGQKAWLTRECKSRIRIQHMSIIYHSAIKGFNEYREQKTPYFEYDGHYGIAYDLESNEPYPKEVYKADFIYCELPFPRGYETFNDRVGKDEGKGWKHMVMLARKMALDLNIPYYFSGDKAFSKIFNTEFQHETWWDVHKTNVIIYSNQKIECNSNIELIQKLYQQHDCGLDMACGYGVLLKEALKYKKKAISMDINPYCIGYLKHELLQADG